jgi:hypothetical protein
MITPEEAGKITQDETQSIRDAEAAIDKALKASYQGTGSVEISTPIEKLTERCRREVLSRYRTAGWDIREKRYEADQRDPRERSYTAYVFSAGVRSGSAYDQPSYSGDWRDR